MKNKMCFFLLLFTTYANAADEKQLILESKQSIKAFATQLKSQLQQGMKTGGPVNAINVCKNTAEEIAQQVSEKAGWEISRTSLKVRNSNNAPDSWEKMILRQFEQLKSHGESVDNLEFSEIIKSGDETVFRYMKAIPTQGVCLSCHGADMSDEIVKTLNTHYPDDQATGFKLGDIRGAFSITRKLN